MMEGLSMRFSIFLMLFATVLFAPRSYGLELNLRDLMDAYYGSGNWSERTYNTPGSGTDIKAAIEAGLTTINSSPGQFGVIKVPAGNWQLDSGINPDKLSGNYIIGEGSVASTIYFDNDTGAAFHWRHRAGGGMKGIRILLEPGKGDSTAYAILAQGTTLSGPVYVQPDQMVFEDIWINTTKDSCGTGGDTSYWYIPVQFDGSGRTSPQGVRGATLKNFQISCARQAGIYLTNVVQYSIENLGTYAPKPSSGGADAIFSGGGTASTNSIHLTASALNINGTLYLTNISNVALQGYVYGFSTASTATYVSGWLNSATSPSGVVGTGSDLTIR
jgi:hypothetical protein